MMKTAVTESSSNKQPIKDIALAVSLIDFGIVGIVVGSLMSDNQIGGDVAHVPRRGFEINQFGKAENPLASKATIESMSTMQIAES